MWKDASRFEALQQEVPELQLEHESCICRLRREEWGRNSSSEYTPRWKKKQASVLGKYCVVGCLNKGEVNTQMADKAELCETIDVKLLDESTVHALCKQHYQAVYPHLNLDIFRKTRKCKTCKRYSQKLRLCPNSGLVEEFLKENTYFKQNIVADNHVCFIVLQVSSCDHKTTAAPHY